MSLPIAQLMPTGHGWQPSVASPLPATQSFFQNYASVPHLLLQDIVPRSWSSRSNAGLARPHRGGSAKLGRVRPICGLCRPTLTRFDSGRCRQIWPDSGQSSADVDQFRAGFGRIYLDRARPKLGRVRPKFGQVRSEVAQVRPVLARPGRIWMRSNELRPMSTNIEPA